MKKLYRKEMAKNILSAKRDIDEVYEVLNSNKHNEYGVPWGYLQSKLQRALKNIKKAKILSQEQINEMVL
jgi:hypothetical protein